MKNKALVLEMVDKTDLKSVGVSRAGSSPAERTILDNIVWVMTDVDFIIMQRNGTEKKAFIYEMELIPDAP